MRELFTIFLATIIVMCMFYLAIAFLCWDINLFDDIAEYFPARMLTLILTLASFGAGLTISEELK